MQGLDEEFLDQALAVAKQAAAAAAQVIAKHYRRGGLVERKADATPVTVADREAELAIKAVLREHFPSHACFGEEFGRDGASVFTWLIDPIDGTRSFVRGYPFFSTQIALMYGGEVVLGVSSASQFCELAWARRSGGAFLNGERIAVSLADRIEHAHVSLGNLKTMAGDPRWLKLAALVRHAERVRGYGDFYHYHLLARGAIDAVIESDVHILDVAALSLLVTEAGGVITDLDGDPIGLSTTSILAAAPGIHGALLAAFHD